MASSIRTLLARATFFALACACAVLSLWGGPSAHAAWSHSSHIGSSGAAGHLWHAMGMTRDGSGNFYVADSLNSRVQKFNSSGAPVLQFGSFGGGAGQFNFPSDVAVDSSGNIFVVDSYNSRVQKFNSSGVYQSTIGSYGSGNGEFNVPAGIAIDASDNLYVTDENNYRVEKFDSSGTYVSQFGSGGTGNGQFSGMAGIAVKSDGTIYVVDTWGFRVQKFSAAGAYVTKFGSSGGGSGQFNVPWDVDIDSSGNVYVADRWNSGVQIFNSSHVYQSTIGWWTWGYGGTSSMSSVEVDAAGNVYTLDTESDKISTFNSSHDFVSRFGSDGSGQLATAAGLARAPDGTLYNVDTANDRVTHFSSSGTVLHTWGTHGSGDGEFTSPQGIAVGPDGSVYVTDSDNHRVQRFTASGVYVGQFGMLGTGGGEFNYPIGAAVAGDGTVYITDCSNDRVQRFTATGTHLGTFGSNGSGNGQFRCPNAAAVAADGSVFILDKVNDRVQKFTASGVYVSQFGTSGSGPGQFQDAMGLSIAPNGDLFVADYGNSRVARFNAAGTFQEQFGNSVSQGETTGFAGLEGIVASANNAVWLSETDNNRITYWTDNAPMTPPNTSTAPAQFRSDGTTSIVPGTFTPQNTVVLKFDVSDTDGSQTLTPWVEVRPIGTALSATCGASVSGATFSGTGVAAAVANSSYSASVTVTGLASNTEYHWRACAVDQSGNAGAWWSFGGSDGTRDFAVDITAPTNPVTLNDGTGRDITTQTLTTRLDANWSAAVDPAVGTGMLDYDWCFTTNNANSCAAGGRVAQGLAQVGTKASATGLSLSVGVTYFSCMRARDVIGNASNYACSNGVQITATPTTTVAGFALRAEDSTTAWQGCNGVTQNISLSLNGAAPLTTSCNALTGAYSFSGVTLPAAGQPVVAWLSSSEAEGATYTTMSSTGADVPDLDIVQDRVTIATESVTATVPRSTVQLRDSVDDADLPIDATSGGRVALAATMELHIDDGVTFTTDGELDTGSVHVEDDATLDTANRNVTIRGTGTESDCSGGPRVSAPLCIDDGGSMNITYGWGTDMSFAPSTPQREVAVTGDVDYSSLFFDNGGRFVLGTGPSQTITALVFAVRGASRLNSDPWSPDVDAYNLGVEFDSEWYGRGEFDVDVRADYSGDGSVRTPGAHVTLAGQQTNSFLGSGRRDWEIGSLALDSVNFDHDFGTTGTGSDIYDSGGVDAPVAAVVQRDAQRTFAIFNRANGANGMDWAVRKYNSFGPGLDAGFGVAGEIVIPVLGDDFATSATLDADGDLLIAGTVGGDWAVRKISAATGAAVASFDGDGLWAPTPSITGTAASIAQRNGNIFVAGDDGGTSWEVRRINSSGTTLDSMSWDGDTGSGAEPTTIAAVCAPPDWANDDLIVVGTVGSAGSRDWAVGRLQPTAGTWDWEPFLDGSARPARIASPGDEDAATTCYDQADVVFVGGTSGDGDAGDTGTIRAFKRSNGAAKLDFGTNGVATIDGTGRDYLTSIANTDNKRYLWVAGGDSANGGRSTVRAVDWDGTVDESFHNGDGLGAFDATPGAERAVSVARLGEIMTVLSTTSSGSGDLAIQQFDPTGRVQAGYTDGATIYRVSGNQDHSHLHVRGAVDIGSPSGTSTVKVDLGSLGGTLDVDGDVRIHPNGQLRGSSGEPIRIGGDLIVNGTLWHQHSRVVLEPRTARVTLDPAATTQFESMTIDGTSGSRTVLIDSTDDLDVDGAFTATGVSCAEPLRLRPTAAAWTLTSGIASISARYLDLANAAAVPGITSPDSQNSGGNSGVTFSSPCGSGADLHPPEHLRVNGLVHPQKILEAPSPTFTWTNRAGAAVNRVDATMLSSPMQGVVALYRFDSGTYTADSSGNGNTLTDVSSSQVAGKFGNASHSTAAQCGGLTTPVIPVTTTFTVDGWFRRGTLTGSDDPLPTLVSRNGAGGKSYSILFDRNANRILGQLTQRGATEYLTADTDATAYTDNEWHHVALTYSRGQLNLYLDGERSASTFNDPIAPDTGAWPTLFNCNANADMDDWEIRSDALSPAEVRGYYRTSRRHVDTVWSDTNVVVAPTVDGAEASITYGGSAAALAREGARYWVSARYRTTGSVWTSWSALDWFETTLDDQTTVSLPDGASAALGAMLPGSDAHAELRVRVQTTSDLGWSMYACGESDTYGLSNGLSGADNQIPRRTTASWPAGTAGFAGLTVVDAPGGKQSPWCGGTDPSNYASQCYFWPAATSGTLIHDRATRDLTAQDVTLSARVNPGPTTRPGKYTGRVQLVVIPNA